MPVRRVRHHPALDPLRTHALPLCAVAVCVFTAYAGWASSLVPAFDDLARLNVPQRVLLGWFARHGWLPLWNPFSFGGQPFLAAGQAGPLYPLNWMFAFMPVVPAMRCSYLLHAALAALGMYGAVYRWTGSRAGAAAGAILFTTSGFMLGHQIHTQMFDAMAWLPLCMWLLLRLLDRPRAKRAAALAAALAMEVYAGHPQVTFEVCLSLCAYTLLRTCRRLAPHTRRAQHNRRANRVAGALWAGGAMALAGALSSPQWLTTWRLWSYSERAQVSPSFLLAGSLPPAGLTQLVAPFAAGGGYTGAPFAASSFESLYGTPLYWEYQSYVGVPGLLLALAATAEAVCPARQTARQRGGPYACTASGLEDARILAAIAAASLLLALGAHTPLRWVLLHVPGFDLFRIPARYVGLLDFCTAALAGFGIGRLSERAIPEDERPSRPAASRRFARSLAVAAAAVAAFSLALRIPAPRAATLVPALLAGATAATALAGRRWFRRRSALAVAAVCVVDSVMYARWMGGFPLVPRAEASYLEPGGAVRYIERHLPGPQPFLRVAAFEDTSLSHDRSLAFQIPAIDGYDSLVPDWYARYVNLTWEHRTLLEQPQRYLDALGIALVVTTPADDAAPLAAAGWKEVYRDAVEVVWQNPDPLSAAWLMPRPEAGGSHLPGQVRLLAWRPDREVWQVNSPREAWLVISQTYDPGWQATVSGHPAPVRRVSGVLTAVAVPGGVHALTLSYHPPGLRAGWMAAGSGAAVWLAAVLPGGRKRRAWSAKTAP